MTKVLSFKFPKDQIVNYAATGISLRRDKIVIEAAARCGAKVDMNQVQGMDRIMMVRCTSVRQEEYMALACPG